MSSWLHDDDAVFYVNIWKGGSRDYNRIVLSENNTFCLGSGYDPFLSKGNAKAPELFGEFITSRLLPESGDADNEE